MSGANDAKGELRSRMRDVRRRAASVPGRSDAIASRLIAMPALRTAMVVMLFDPVGGEPDLRAFAQRCRERQVDLVVPVADRAAPFPVSPDRVDAVIVPGLAFTPSGLRLGRGGGWYDRFLADVRPTCITVGVCLDEQVLDEIPTEPHDVAVRWVVTPTRTLEAAPAPSSTSEPASIREKPTEP